MTHKIFWQDSYQTSLDTRVLHVDGDQVTVEQTIFFAFSGGQESDRGTIAGREVLDARKAGREIIYTLPADHGLEPGDPVRMTIDWERRYRLMRLHFAAEVVLELVYRLLDPIEKIGAHIAEEKARIDFRWEENIAPHLPALQHEAMRIILEDQLITSSFCDEIREERYWEIKEFSRVPCGGTHLKATGEIGGLKLKRKNIGRAKERIEIYLMD